MPDSALPRVVPTVLPVTMVGSYPRPLWYRHQLHGADLLHALKLEEHAQAYEDATACAIRDQEDAGLDVVTDGQMYFDDYGGSIGSFVWYWYERLPGFFPNKMRNPSAVAGQAGRADIALKNNWGGTTTTGRIERGPVRLAQMYEIARELTTRPLKVSVGAGPINLAMHVFFDDPGAFYRNQRDLVEDLIPVFNAEITELVRAGAEIIQLEDLGAWVPVRTGDDAAFRWVRDTVNRVFEGVDAKRAWHFCLGAAYGNNTFKGFEDKLGKVLEYVGDTDIHQFVLDFALRDMRDVGVLRMLPADKEVAAGVINVRSLRIESEHEVADRIRTLLEVLPAERLWLTTDCGLRVLPRIVAREKLRSLATGAQIVRAELA